MAKPDDLVAAALFTDRDVADEAWGRLVEADIPASVITEMARNWIPLTPFFLNSGSQGMLSSNHWIKLESRGRFN